MYKKKHTPGPWRAIMEPTESGAEFWSIYGANGEAVEYMTLRNGGELEANARLTSAGPELLEALKLLLSSAHDYQTGIAEAEAAIRKAEGNE